MGKNKRKEQGLDPSIVEWTDESIPAAEFLSQYDLPQVVKLHSGEYGNFGCGTDVDVDQPFLLHTFRDCEKVLAQNVVWDNQRERYVETGVQIIIPTNYPGWFAIGSETNSMKVKPWTTVSDIPINTTKAILATRPVSCYKLSKRTTTGEKLYLKRDYTEGEVFEVCDLFVEQMTNTEPTCCIRWMFGGKKTIETTDEVEYILSKDSNNTDVLLPFIAKGAFYKVDKFMKKDQLDSDSVYNICDIIDSIDFPCHVNLMHGKAPRSLSQFSGTVRLEEVYKEDTVVACSMGSSKFSLLEFPMDSGIQFIPAKNNGQLLHHYFVQEAMEYCLDNVLPYIISLKVIQNFFSGISSRQEDLTKAPMREAPVPTDIDILPLKPGTKPVIRPNNNKNKDNVDTGNHSHESDDFTDDESDIQSGESHYATIPCDQSPDKNKEFERFGYTHSETESLHVASMLPRRNVPAKEDTDEYLVPAHLRKQTIYTNVGNESIHRNASHSSFQNKTGVICPANSINDEHERPLQPFIQTPRQPFMLQRLPSGGRERMDRFLQDSLEELNRIRSSCSECEDGTLTTENIDAELNSDLENQMDETSQMKATLDAFLEEIFDCKNLEKGQVSANIENIVRSKEQQHNNLIDMPSQSFNEHEMVNHHTVPNYKSLSALDLAADTGTNAYVSNSVCSVDAKCEGSSALDIKDLDLQARGGENENTSSSSRSASSIYRQMKYASYGRSESHQIESPYPRTDSGIFISPRYSLSESGYNKGIYQAMSEVSWAPPDDISSLSVEEVSLSMIYIGIKQKGVDLFFDQQIDGQQLLDFDETLLKDGFPELNSLERKKVLDFIKGWRPKKLT